MESDRINNFSQPMGTQKISHLGFADDVLVFCNAGKKSIKNLMELINNYQKTSGQLLNASKCTFIISKRAKQCKINFIEQYTGFKKQDMPMKYLDCPIFSGRMKKQYFQDLINNIRARIQGWSTNLLNQAGRLILITHVLQSIPVHICAAICPPKSILKEIDKLMSNCFWGNSNNHLKHHWIAWKIICKPKTEGGLGLRCIKDIIKVQSLKLCWKLRTDNSLWTKFMKDKYKKEMQEGSEVKSCSLNWRRIRDAIEEADSYMTGTNNNITWRHSKDGKFCTKSTWNAIRSKEAELVMFKYIWNKHTPRRISVFMWKLIHQKLPLDENIKKIGISLASMCRCCYNRKCESQTHLFYSSEAARAVWSWFQRNIGLQVRSHSMATQLKWWWFRSRLDDDESTIFHCIPSLICWELWKARNRANFDDEDMDVEDIIEKIRIQFGELMKITNMRGFSRDLKEAINRIGKK